MIYYQNLNCILVSLISLPSKFNLSRCVNWNFCHRTSVMVADWSREIKTFLTWCMTQKSFDQIELKFQRRTKASEGKGTFLFTIRDTFSFSENNYRYSLVALFYTSRLILCSVALCLNPSRVEHEKLYNVPNINNDNSSCFKAEKKEILRFCSVCKGRRQYNFSRK